jgi:hypothetical protein
MSVQICRIFSNVRRVKGRILPRYSALHTVTQFANDVQIGTSKRLTARRWAKNRHEVHKEYTSALHESFIGGCGRRVIGCGRKSLWLPATLLSSNTRVHRKPAVELIISGWCNYREVLKSLPGVGNASSTQFLTDKDSAELGDSCVELSHSTITRFESG